MTDAQHDEPDMVQGLAPASATSGPLSLDDRATSLRGAAALGVGRNFWLFAGALGLVVFAAVLVVSFLSVANDNARIDRLKTRGIPVAITVTNCAGNIGGSGSNSAGYTCHGDYIVGGVTYHELIGSMTTFSASGADVSGVVDPSRHSTVVLSSAVRTSAASPWAFAPTGLTAVVFVALTLAFLRRARRSDVGRHTTPVGTRSPGR